MSNSSWFDYVQRRYNALLNINVILQARGILIERESYPFFRPRNLLEFRLHWGDTTITREKTAQSTTRLSTLGQFTEQPELKTEYDYEIIPEEGLDRTQITHAILMRDRHPFITTIRQIQSEKEGIINERVVLIAFVGRPKNSNSVTRTKINKEFLPNLLQIRKYYGYSDSSVVTNIMAFLLTHDKLGSDARRYLIELNRLYGGGIQHYTINELQCDKIHHILQPESIELATNEEIRRWIDSQKELSIGRNRIALNYTERRERIETETEKKKFDKMIDEEILSKLPILNYTDVLVKWYGFKLGDVLKITRRFGQSKFVYKRVVFNIQELL